MPETRRTSQQGEDTSTAKIIAMLMVVIALFGWAFAAAAYTHAEQGWRHEAANSEVHSDGLSYDKCFKEFNHKKRESSAALGDFFGNAVLQVPNVFSVIAFNFQHRLWLV